MQQSSGWGRATEPAATPLPATADAVVVGLGGTGLTCLLHLAQAGLQVVGIDRAGIASGAAGSNGGFLLAGIAAFYDVAVERYGRDAARAMYQQTLATLDSTFADTELGARRLGSLRIADDAGELEECARHANALQADGFPVELYEGREGRGLLIPSDGVFDPVRRASVLAQRVTHAGGLLVTGRRVVDLTGDAVTLDDASVRTRHVVVAVDGGLERVLPELVDGVRTVQLQMLATAPLPTIVAERPVYRRDGLDYYQQTADGRLFVGGGRDVGGPLEWLDDGRGATPSAVVQDYLDRLAATVAGGPVPVTHRWAAAVAMTTSGLPVVGRASSGAWVLGGYNGTGNVIGPLLGAAVARRITGQRAESLTVWERTGMQPLS